MSRASWARSIQALLIACQMANGAAAAVHHSPAIAVIGAVFFGSLQLFVVEMALHIPPPQPKQ